MSTMKSTNALSFQCCGPPGCGKLDAHDKTKRYCVGTQCMGWRYVEETGTLGYCGLAGQPDLDTRP